MCDRRPGSLVIGLPTWMELAGCRRRDLLMLIFCTVAFFTFFHLRTLQQDPTEAPLVPQGPSALSAYAANDDGSINSTLGVSSPDRTSNDSRKRPFSPREPFLGYTSIFKS
jgi:hypothetical protein